MIDRPSTFLRNKRLLIIPLALGFLIRLIYQLDYANLPEWTLLTVDNYYHHNWAQAIADGNWLGDTTWFRAPFYIYCLALIYKVFRASIWIARLFGLIIGLGTITTTYLITDKLFGRKAAFLAGLIYAFYPLSIYFEAELLLDPLFTLLLTGSFYLFFKGCDNSRQSLYWSGLLFGLAALTRPTILILFPVVIYFLWKQVRQPGQRSFNRLIPFILPIIFLLALSFGRNLYIAGDPVLISSQGGINLYLGNNSSADGISAVMPEPLGFNWQIAQITHEAESAAGEKLLPGEVSSYWSAKAISWIKAHPGEFLILYATKLYRNISNKEISNNRDLTTFFSEVKLLGYNPLCFGLIFSLAIIGFIRHRKERNISLILVSMIIYLLATSLFFFNSRFRLPLLPFYIIMASAGLETIHASIKARRIATPIWFGIFAAIISFAPLVPLAGGSANSTAITSGIYLYHQGQYQKAIDLLQQARQADSTFPEVNLNIGACYLRLGNDDSSRFFFSQELIFNPGRVKAKINLASMELLGGRFYKARQLINDVFQYEPYDITANLIFLRALEGENELSLLELQDSCDLAIKRTDGHIAVINQVASLFYQRGDIERAEFYFKMAVESRPPPIETDDALFTADFINSKSKWNARRAESCFYLGTIAGQHTLFGSAVHWSEKAIAFDSSQYGAYRNLITALEATGQNYKADSVRQTMRLRFNP